MCLWVKPTGSGLRGRMHDCREGQELGGGKGLLLAGERELEMPAWEKDRAETSGEIGRGQHQGRKGRKWERVGEVRPDRGSETSILGRMDRKVFRGDWLEMAGSAF